jgi:hypothetical protein
MDFLSLSSTTISKQEILFYSAEINDFLKDVRHTCDNINNNNHTDMRYLSKFKLLHDIIKLYNNPKIVNILKYIDESDVMDTDDDDDDLTYFNNILDMNNSTTSESECDTISEDDKLQDIYTNMIDREYDNIQINSILRQNINITRIDPCSFE